MKEEYTIRVTEDVRVCPSPVGQLIRWVLVFVLALLLVASHLVGQNLLLVMPTRWIYALAILCGCALLFGRTKVMQSPVEIKCFSNRVEVNRLNIPCSGGKTERQHCVFLYANGLWHPVCAYSKRSRCVRFSGMGYGERSQYNKDGTLASVAERAFAATDKHHCEFQISKSCDIRLMEELETHSSVSVTHIRECDQPAT